jgi:ribosome-binding protein aMBF1 (putative translation factor)
MKKNLREKIKGLPSLDDIVSEHCKDPKFKAEFERMKLRLAVARAIKTAREKAGLSQAELASALGLTQPMIGRLESLKDRSLPSLDLLAKISAATQRRLVVDEPGIHFELVANR